MLYWIDELFLEHHRQLIEHLALGDTGRHTRGHDAGDRYRTTGIYARTVVHAAAQQRSTSYCDQGAEKSAGRQYVAFDVVHLC